MKRAALYIRVSTDEQARHGLSLGEQRADLEHYAQVHHYTIVDVYADQGNTARKALSRRKELQRLLDDVRADKIDIILFKCLDRWFRNIRDYYKVQDILDEHGVDWECTQEKYNTTTTNGRLMLNIKLSVAQNESDQTSDRIRYVNAGKMKRKEALTGEVPYGYIIKDKHYALVPEQAEVVKEAFSRVIAGDAAFAIARDMNARGIRISARSMYSILRRSVYTGVYRGIDDYFPAIIGKDDFKRVQDILATHPRRTRKGNIFLFTGLIACPKCGNILIANVQYNGAKGKKRVVYKCMRRYGTGQFSAGGRCAYGGGVSESVVERYIVANLEQLLNSFYMKFHGRKSKNHVDFDALKKSAEGRLKRAKDLYIDGVIEREEFDERARGIQEELDELDLKMSKQKKMSSAVLDTLKHIDTFKDGYALLDRKSKREFWHRIIRRIELGEPPERAREGYSDFRITFF